MYKISNGLSTCLMKDIFPINRNPKFLVFQTISNLGPKIWDLVPSNLKEISDLDKLKKAIKQWKP